MPIKQNSVTENKTAGTGILRHGMSYWCGHMIARLVSFLLLPVYTAYIVPSDWGILNLLIVSGDLAALMVGCQLPSALYRFWALSSAEIEKKQLAGLAVIAPLILSCVTFVPLYMWAEECANLIGISGYGNYVRILLITVQLSLVLNIIQSEMRLRDESKIYAVLDVGMNFSLAGVNIFLVAVMNLGIRGILIGNLAIFTIVVVSLLPRFLRRANLNMDLKTLKRLLIFSLPLIPSALAMAAVHNVDRYFIQFFLGTHEVGLYSIGYKFGIIVNIIVLGPFLLVWEPKSYEIAKSPEASRTYGEVFSYLTALAVFVSTGLTGASEEIVQVMTNPRYWDACSVIPFICWSYVLFAMDSVARMGLLVYHKTKTLAGIVIITFLINIIGNVILIPRIGMMGAAWATLCSFVLLFVFDLVLAQRYLPIFWQWRRLIIIAVVALIILGCMISIRGFGLWTTVFIKILILFLYPVLLYLFGFINKETIKTVLGRRSLLRTTS